MVKSFLWIEVWMTTFYYWIRNLLKKSLKRLFENRMEALHRLKTIETDFNQKVVLLSNSAVKRTKALVRGRHKNGINLFGFLTAELGIGEAARSTANSLKAVGVNASLINIPLPAVRQCDFSLNGFSKDHLYPINLIHVNAPELPPLYIEQGMGCFKGKYNIGFWNWELSEFPETWRKSFRYCDEVWVPSSFTLASIAKKSPIPVLKIPIAVEIGNSKNLSRSSFGLKEDDFIFLFVFDFFSYFERKNPLAIIKAFRLAFSPSEKARLVIKCSNSSFDPQAMEKMKQETNGLNVDIIDRRLDKDEMNALMSLCDCYISLHRSEGFGLTLAEAMCLEKPVIATAFSGNMDFMDVNNSYLTRYELVPVTETMGPYQKGNFWAEPDVGHAAELMRFVYEKKEIAQQTARRGAEGIRRHLNHQAVGNEIKNRIERVPY